MPFVRRMDILAQSQGGFLLCKPTAAQLNCNKKNTIFLFGLFSKSSKNSCLTKSKSKVYFSKRKNPHHYLHLILLLSSQDISQTLQVRRSESLSRLSKPNLKGFLICT